MDEGIKVEIVSPEHLLLSEIASSVSVPGVEGYFTVMGDHAPLMSILKPGFVTVVAEKDTRSFYVGGGFADVSNNIVTILAEETKAGEDFKSEEIETAIKSAEEQLDGAETPADKNSAQALLDGWKNLIAEAKSRPAD